MQRLNAAWRAEGLPVAGCASASTPARWWPAASAAARIWSSACSATPRMWARGWNSSARSMPNRPRYCTIVVGEPTWLRLGGLCPGIRIGGVILRGRHTPMAAWRIDSAAARRSGAATPPPATGLPVPPCENRYDPAIDLQVSGTAPVNDIFVGTFARNADQVADLLLRQPDFYTDTRCFLPAEGAGQPQQAARHPRRRVAQQRILQGFAGLAQALAQHRNQPREKSPDWRSGTASGGRAPAPAVRSLPARRHRRSGVGRPAPRFRRTGRRDR